MNANATKIEATKFRIVRNIEGVMIVANPQDIFAWCDVNGFEVSGLNLNHRQRAELQGMPVIRGLAGPMFDGDAIRYEDREAYSRLSA